MSTLGRRYAQAIASLAGDGARGGETMAEAAQQLQDFAEAMHRVPALGEVLHNPSFRRQLPALLPPLLEKMVRQDLARRAILLLVRNGRIDLCGAVAQSLQALGDVRAHRLRARVQTVVPLTAAQQERLRRALEARFDAKVELSWERAPALLGGLVCHINGLTLDGSLRAALQTMTQRLMTDSLNTKAD